MPQIPTLSQARPSVIGLGYVGLPLAVALGRIRPAIGFDIDIARVSALTKGHDATGECSTEELASANQLRFSHNADELKAANVHIIAVPTPVNRHKWPDLSPLEGASVTVGRQLKRGDVVVYESTVYPGATEEVCVPVLERESGLRFNVDFTVGYSPERINPGDKHRRLPDIVKITSGSTPEAAAFIDALYREIVPAGTHLAPSIRVAEAAKAIENTQRDVNIALINQLAQLFSRLDLDTEAVLAAAGTKWNFLPFRPGLVGGHCIGVDPYYLVHKAQEVGYHPELILAARRINESMSAHVTSELMKLMATRRLSVVGARILVLGVTFKENCPDLRNTRVVEIVDALRSYHADVDVYDPWADAAECRHEYGLELIGKPAAGIYDAVVIAVAHQDFAQLGAAGVREWCKADGIVYDVKYLFDRKSVDGRL
jgi:UDP-N-acetyl-D-galactosamine dehydrogenase